VMTLLVLGALVAANYIAVKKNKSHDFTHNKIFTLAPQTVSTLQGLKEKVRAIGFMESSHPYYDVLENLFERYQHEAPDKFEYVFKDPKRSPDLAEKYKIKEGQATVVLTRGEGTAESHTTLNIASEQELTNALIKINSVGEQKVYFTQGHEEWSLDPVADPQTSEVAGSVSELKRTLSQEGYAPEALTLAGKTEVPRDAALVIIAGGKQAFADPEIKALDQYVDQGGRLIFFAQMQTESGLGPVLKNFGIEVDEGVVADDHFADDNPYIVMSQFYGDHEITKLLSQMSEIVEFPFARGLTLLHAPQTSAQVVPLVFSSPFAWEQAKAVEDPRPADGAKVGKIPLVAASTLSALTQEKAKKRFDEARVVVFGASGIVIDPNWGVRGNRNMVMNAIAWATQQVNKITLRPPDRDISTIDLDGDMLGKIRFIATDLFPLSLLALGLAIWISRRNK
jgi:hypothetical protein